MAVFLFGQNDVANEFVNFLIGQFDILTTFFDLIGKKVNSATLKSANEMLGLSTENATKLVIKTGSYNFSNLL